MTKEAKDQLSEAIIRIIRSGGPICAFLVVATLCVVIGWRYAGNEMASFAVQYVTAQSKAAEAAQKTVELAAETIDRYDRKMTDARRIP